MKNNKEFKKMLGAFNINNMEEACEHLMYIFTLMKFVKQSDLDPDGACDEMEKFLEIEGEGVINRLHPSFAFIERAIRNYVEMRKIAHSFGYTCEIGFNCDSTTLHAAGTAINLCDIDPTEAMTLLERITDLLNTNEYKSEKKHQIFNVVNFIYKNIPLQDEGVNFDHTRYLQ